MKESKRLMYWNTWRKSRRICSPCDVLVDVAEGGENIHHYAEKLLKMLKFVNKNKIMRDGGVRIIGNFNGTIVCASKDSTVHSICKEFFKQRD